VTDTSPQTALLSACMYDIIVTYDLYNATRCCMIQQKLCTLKTGGLAVSFIKPL